MTARQQVGTPRHDRPSDAAPRATARPDVVAAEGHHTRSDIQGLRAVAVGAVVAYHVWPDAVPGGYVGVDVFFVLSGFLITAHLLRHPPTTARDLLTFWGRRVRRLLPASALVAVATVLAAALWLPSSLLPETAAEGIASALYVQNWALAGAASDYLAAAGTATPFRHYWSLSVEEQFYVVWPVLIGVAVLATLAVRRRRGASADAAPGLGVAAVLGAVVLASFAWSVHLVATAPAAAYYVTPARIWELGLGGLVAVAAPRLRSRHVPAGVRTAAAWAGLAAVAWSAMAYDHTTAFPGAGALAPVVGTAVVVLAHVPERGLLGRALAWGPVQLVGDVSYSTYLWHWPLVVLAPYVVGGPPGLAVWMGVVAASVGLAWVTKTWVEDPVRRSPRLARPRWTVVVLATCTLAGVGAAAALGAWAGARESASAADVAAAAVAHADCFGVAATRPGAACDDVADAVWSSPAQAAADKPRVYADGCWNEQPYTTRRTCHYPAPDGVEAPLRVALVGNSHAGHWFPPLEALAEEHGWEITTYLVSVCYPVDVPVAFDDPDSTTGCSAWNRWVREEVTGGAYDVVVMSSRTDQFLAEVPRAEQDATAQEAYARVLTELTDAGLGVLVIRDTPNMAESVPDCVDAFGVAACDRPRDVALEVDPLAQAAADDDSGRVAVLDVTDTMCTATACRPVIGGLIAYFDHGHLTATFARTFAPELGEAMDGLLSAGARSAEGSVARPSGEG